MSMAFDRIVTLVSLEPTQNSTQGATPQHWGALPERQEGRLTQPGLGSKHRETARMCTGFPNVPRRTAVLRATLVFVS